MGEQLQHLFFVQQQKTWKILLQYLLRPSEPFGEMIRCVRDEGGTFPDVWYQRLHALPHEGLGNNVGHIRQKLGADPDA